MEVEILHIEESSCYLLINLLLIANPSYFHYCLHDASRKDLQYSYLLYSCPVGNAYFIHTLNLLTLESLYYLSLIFIKILIFLDLFIHHYLLLD